MCNYRLHAPNGVYYFRMPIPVRLRPLLGKREFKFSLGTKDPLEAKRRILQVETPHHAALLEQAEAELARRQGARTPSPVPFDPFANMGEDEARAMLATDPEMAAKDDRREALADYIAFLEQRLKGSTEQMPPELRAFKYMLEGREFDKQLLQDQLTIARAEARGVNSGVAGESQGGDAAPMAPAYPKSHSTSQRTPQGNSGAVSITGLYERYAAQDGIAPGTVKQWRTYINHLVAFLGHDDAGKVTPHDLIRWRESLRTKTSKAGKTLSAKTINGSYMAAANVTFAYGLNQLDLTNNPMASVQSVRADNKPELRERDFTKAEQKAILSAALAPTASRLSGHRALATRWVPWLCAYSGARVNEITQLRAEDVKQIEGVWTIRITPDAGGVKTNKARTVPIHEHLIAQGFLDIVKGKKGPLFYVASEAGKTSDRGQHKKTGMFLAVWVRKDVGITDPNVAPNHGWRHTFKTICRGVEIEESAADYMQGHAHKGQGRRYGSNTIPALANQLAKFPRYVTT